MTAVINASAAGLIEAARAHNIKVLAGCNGISGALSEDLIDTDQESIEDIYNLRYTPGGAFGSCRVKLKSFAESQDEYLRLFEVFSSHNIGYFFYNGGGDSQDTTHKIAQVSRELNYPLVCVGIPKTIDNDLPLTDCSPGFGSAAKYLASSVREIDFDLASMAASSTKVFILEVMGRYTGWLAAATGIAAEMKGDAPHLILFPEVPFVEADFLRQVDLTVKRYGRCVIVAAEGLKDPLGHTLAKRAVNDAFGHRQLGGIAPFLAERIRQQLGYPYHWAVASYLQRAARHIASQVDLEQAYEVGKAALDFALAGKSDIMTTIVRDTSSPYRWHVGYADLAQVANLEKKVPRDFITDDGFHITAHCREYLAPLIQGEAPMRYRYRDGLPDFVRLKRNLVDRILTR